MNHITTSDLITIGACLVLIAAVLLLDWAMGDDEGQDFTEGAQDGN